MAAVVFDLDDTLYPQIRYVHSAFGAVAQHVYERFGLSPDDVYGSLRRASEMGYRGREFQRVCDIYRLDVRIVPELIDVGRAHQPTLNLAYGVDAALQGLRRRGLRTAILTNGLPSVQAAKVRALGVDALVDHVVYANKYAEEGKPAAEPFLATLHRLHVTPDRAVMVGNDRVHDIEGARAVGMRTVLLARGPRPIIDGGADIVVDDLSDIAQVALDLVIGAVAYAA
jgi:putative hydrolase of the HAD superfamily